MGPHVVATRARWDAGRETMSANRDANDQLARLLRTIDELEREHEAVHAQLAEATKARETAQARAHREEELQRQLQKELSEIYVDIAKAKNAIIAREATRMERAHARGMFGCLSTTTSTTSSDVDADAARLEREIRFRERQDALERGFERERERSTAFKASLRAYESRIDAEAKLAARKAALGGSGPEDKQS